MSKSDRRGFLKRLAAGGVLVGIALSGVSKLIPNVHAPAADAPSTGWHLGSGSMVEVGQIVFIDSSGPTYCLRDGYIGNGTTEVTPDAIFTDAITNA